MLARIFSALGSAFRSKSSEFSPAKILLFFSFLLGLFFVFVVPPFQKPDEPTHFYKAISIASGNFLCEKKSGNVFQNPIPKYLFDFPVQTFAMHIASNANYVFPKSAYGKFITQRNFDRSSVNEPSSCSLPFTLYIPVGLVLFLPVQIGLNPLLIFYLGRLTNFLLAFGIFFLAFRVAPKKIKLLPLFLLSLPMVLYQISSFSKDALHLSCGVLAFCLLVSFFEKKKIHPREIVLFFLTTALTILARPQYALLAFTSLLLPYKKITKTKLFSHFTSLLFIFFIVAVIGLFLSLEVYSAKAASLGNATPNSYVNPEVQMQFLKENWLHIPSIIGQTFDRNSIFYFQSAIGMLGWLEFGVPWYVYLFYLCLGIFVFQKTRDDWPELTRLQFLIVNGIVWGTIVAILLAFYLYASPVAAESVSGIQGRYFLLLIPFLFWIFASIFSSLEKKFLVICLLVVFFAISLTVVARYYDSNHHFYRGVESLPIVARTNLTAISQTVQQKISVENGKKLRGVTFFAFKQPTALWAPYQLQVLDPTCSATLRTVVIDPTTIQTDDWNDIVFPTVSNVSAVCVKIEPYHMSVPDNDSLQLANTATGQIILIPIYLN